MDVVGPLSRIGRGPPGTKAVPYFVIDTPRSAHMKTIAPSTHMKKSYPAPR